MDENKRKYLQSLLVKRTRLVIVIRKALKKTQQQMADLLGMSRATYIKEENSQQISGSFYLLIGSYWDYYYREILKKWKNNPQNKEYRNLFGGLTELLDKENVYRIKDEPPVDDDYAYFMEHSFNQEWWEAIKKSYYNELDDAIINDVVEKGEVLINIDELDVVEIEMAFKILSKPLKKYNKRVYVLTFNKDFEKIGLKDIKERLSKNDEMLSVLLENRHLVDFSLSELSENEILKKIIEMCRYRLLIIDKKESILNDVRFTTNEKAKRVFKRIFNNKKFPLNEIGHYNNMMVLHVKLKDNKLVYHDCYYDDIYKELPDDAIIAFVIISLLGVVDEISVEEQNRIENIIKEEFPQYKDSLRENIDDIIKCINIRS